MNPFIYPSPLLDGRKLNQKRTARNIIFGFIFWEIIVYLSTARLKSDCLLHVLSAGHKFEPKVVNLPVLIPPGRFLILAVWVENNGYREYLVYTWNWIRFLQFQKVLSSNCADPKKKKKRKEKEIYAVKIWSNLSM